MEMGCSGVGVGEFGCVSEEDGCLCIEVDFSFNVIMIYDNINKCDMYVLLIVEFDVQLQQIEIEVFIVDIDCSKFFDMGVEWGVCVGVVNSIINVIIVVLEGMNLLLFGVMLFISNVVCFYV